MHGLYRKRTLAIVRGAAAGSEAVPERTVPTPEATMMSEMAGQSKRHARLAEPPARQPPTDGWPTPTLPDRVLARYAAALASYSSS
jgi:hypothetical protein